MGGRIAGGLWVNDAHTFGYGWSGFITEQRADFFAANSAGGIPILDRPFTAPVESDLDYPVAGPGTRRHLPPKRAASPAANFTLSRASTTANRGTSRSSPASATWTSTNTWSSSSRPTPSAHEPLFINNAAVNQVNLVDRFRTRNQFWGMEFGGRGEVTHKCFSFAVTAKVGFGNIHQTLDIAGQTTRRPPAAASWPSPATSAARIRTASARWPT